jgi:hypothetical protein
MGADPRPQPSWGASPPDPPGYFWKEKGEQGLWVGRCLAVLERVAWVVTLPRAWQSEGEK